jgi:sialic acid synthase
MGRAPEGARVRELTIGTRRIADDEPCYVIAEIGHNHGGKVATAVQMIKVAAACGASAVKLQKRDNENLYTRALLDQPYENENSFGATYGEHRKALEFGLSQFVSCRTVAGGVGVDFFSTAFDEASADFLMGVGVPAFKIASGDLTNIPLIRHVASFEKPIIISTGGGDWQDVDRAVDALVGGPWRLSFALLHCTAAYPVHDFSELNLLAIVEMRARYPGTVIGWSGHDNGIAMSLVAYSLGARIIEKHFTLNRASKGTDHAFSLEPAGLRKMVRDLDRARLSFGDGIKRSFPSEAGPLAKMAKSLVAARDLPVGHILEAGDIVRKSPAGRGLPAYEQGSEIGFTLARAIRRDEALTFEHIKCDSLH